MFSVGVQSPSCFARFPPSLVLLSRLLFQVRPLYHQLIQWLNPADFCGRRKWDLSLSVYQSVHLWSRLIPATSRSFQRCPSRHVFCFWPASIAKSHQSHMDCLVLSHAVFGSFPLLAPVSWSFWFFLTLSAQQLLRSLAIPKTSHLARLSAVASYIYLLELKQKHTKSLTSRYDNSAAANEELPALKCSSN